jgi:mRNA interferase RelE/StbE
VYEVILLRKCRKFLDAFQFQEHERVVKSIIELEQNPRPRGVEKLKGSEFWRIREGNYRIVYVIDDKNRTVTITRIGHRREIYRDI